MSQEYREFERTSTVAANPYIGPRVRRYLGEMQGHLREAGFAGDFFIVQSSGGLFDTADAQRACIRMLELGPAAGVIGTNVLCDATGIRSAIAFDMGGTTAKAGVIHDGQVLMTGNAMIGGYVSGLPVQMPMVDIQEVGTGGGSIARVEAGGALRVGPQSAGAEPGPVCYGLGGQEPTITDANLVLGRLSADRFLGGEMPLDVAAALAALRERTADPLNLDPIAAAEGILRIATTKMSHVVRWVTTERGLDAADFTLVAYGGAGPLHAAMIARELRIGRVVIPIAPGHFSAFGMLVTDLRRDFVSTWFTPLAAAPFGRMEEICRAMEDEGREAVRRSGIATANVTVSRAADMRYVGQEHAVTVELPMELFRNEDRAGIKRRFDATHDVRYGHAAEREPAEIVSLRSASADYSTSRASSTSLPGAICRPVRLREAAGRCRSTGAVLSRRRFSIGRGCSPAIASPGRRWSRSTRRRRSSSRAMRSPSTNTAISSSRSQGAEDERRRAAPFRDQGRSGDHRDRAQLSHRRHRGNEDQPDAPRLTT